MFSRCLRWYYPCGLRGRERWFSPSTQTMWAAVLSALDACAAGSATTGIFACWFPFGCVAADVWIRLRFVLLRRVFGDAGAITAGSAVPDLRYRASRTLLPVDSACLAGCACPVGSLRTYVNNRQRVRR